MYYNVEKIGVSSSKNVCKMRIFNLIFVLNKNYKAFRHWPEAPTPESNIFTSKIRHGTL
jgi:hypothetical protein